MVKSTLVLGAPELGEAFLDIEMDAVSAVTFSSRFGCNIIAGKRLAGGIDQVDQFAISLAVDMGHKIEVCGFAWFK